MRLQNVDLNLFLVFDAIYTERNLTRASDVLHITQPAVSNALSRLRRTLNDDLFVRAKGGVVPTPVADNIIGRIRQALNMLDDSVSEADVFDPEHSDKRFRISMNDLGEALFLPELQQILQEQAPGIVVESFFSPRNEITTDFSSGLLDLAIDVPLIADPQLQHTFMSRERYVCLLRAGHPAAQVPLTMDRYLALDHISVSSRRAGAGYVENTLNTLGLQRKIQLRVKHFMIAALIATQTDLALTVPERFARRYNASIVQLPFDLRALDMHVYWHKSADADKANIWLRNQVLGLSAADSEQNG